MLILVAVGDAADPLVSAIQARLPKITVGDGMDPTSEMGPLVTREHHDKVVDSQTATTQACRPTSVVSVGRGRLYAHSINIDNASWRNYLGLQAFKVRPGGFEPPTRGLEVRRSVH